MLRYRCATARDTDEFLIHPAETRKRIHITAKQLCYNGGAACSNTNIAELIAFVKVKQNQNREMQVATSALTHDDNYSLRNDFTGLTIAALID